MTDMTFACPHCDRVLGDADARYQHVKARHGKKAARAVFPKDDREMSLARELTEAVIAYFTEGKEPPHYLRSMFPEHFTVKPQ